MKPPQLSLIIPVFNEKNRLKRGINVLSRYLQTQPYSCEIIIVDDGSTDQSTNFLDPIPNLFVLKTQKNFGKGHAIRLGVEAASGRYIIFTDVDLSVPPSCIPLFLKNLSTHDVVIGSRRLRDSRIIESQAHVRQSLGHGFTQLCNVVLNLHHTDYTCGFKGFRGHVAKKLFALSHINRWAFDPEIIFLAHKYHFSVTESPVTWKNDPQTKVNLLPSIISSFLDLLSIRFHFYHYG